MAVDVRREGSSVVVTINRPERRNALDGATMAGIGIAFTEAEHDDEVRSVILTGAGDTSFCAGADLKGGEPAPEGAPGIEVFTTRCYPKPVIAAVNGSAIGGGFELMLASDLVVAADHALFGVPEVLRGLIGAGCTTRLAARLPPAIVAELCFVGAPVPATRAYELGLVNAIVPGPEVLPRALALAEQLEQAAPIGLRVTKELLFREQGMHDAGEWAEIRAMAAPVFATADAAEGRAAFAEKRPPRWSGR